MSAPSRTTSEEPPECGCPYPAWSHPGRGQVGCRRGAAGPTYVGPRGRSSRRRGRRKSAVAGALFPSSCAQAREIFVQGHPCGSIRDSERAACAARPVLPHIASSRTRRIALAVSEQTEQDMLYVHRAPVHISKPTWRRLSRTVCFSPGVFSVGLVGSTTNHVKGSHNQGRRKGLVHTNSGSV